MVQSAARLMTTLFTGMPLLRATWLRSSSPSLYAMVVLPPAGSSAWMDCTDDTIMRGRKDAGTLVAWPCLASLSGSHVQLPHGASLRKIMTNVRCTTIFGMVSSAPGCTTTNTSLGSRMVLAADACGAAPRRRCARLRQHL